MDFSVQYLSFFVLQSEAAEATPKSYKHYQTLGHEDYETSEIKTFLDGEFARICKRKAELHPSSENVPTKLGRFIVEPGYELASNPNYNLFQRLRMAGDQQAFAASSDELVRMYMDTSSARGGALIVASAKLYKYFDEPLLFVLKCDFEQKIARIADERSLISKVDHAISARNLKWIQYPHMPEEGMLEPGELKIHQSSHARYFEDFLKFVTYERPMPEVVSSHVMEMVHEYIDSKWQGLDPDTQERKEEQERLEQWAYSEKRDIQERWSHEHVLEATARLVELKPDLELKLKLDGVQVRGKLADYGDKIHVGRLNGRYVVLIEGDGFEFEKGVSPIELLQPDELERVIERIKSRPPRQFQEDVPQQVPDDAPPWDEDV